MIRKFLIFPLLYMASVQARCFCYNWFKPKLTLGFGPVWTSEIGDDRFTIIATGAEVSNQNHLGYNVGPWLDGTLRVKCGDYVVIDAYGGGGWVRKGHGEAITKQVILPALTDKSYYEWDLNVHNNFLVTFVGAGPCYDIFPCFFISLTEGYAFSKQQWNAPEVSAPYDRNVKNKWKAPYLGITGQYSISDYSALEINYRALIGDVTSRKILISSGQTVSNICRFVPRFFGNLVSLSYTYQFDDNWNTGISFIYNEFQNFKKGCVTPATTATTNNAYTNRLQFNMFAVTLLLGYNY